ncbi:MAG: SpoIIE family protein phosphatase [Bacteroidales bacterium]|nr:SpoIIE family protein phosphatase [Bacteroidales bacterium]
MIKRGFLLSRVITGIKMLVIFVFFSGLSPAFSQSYYFDSYGVSDNLSSSKVYTIIQDRDDYLWLGTESGVTRWDGSEFDNFSSDDGLAIGGVYSIYEDRTGRLWMGHLNGGLSCYENEAFHRVSFDTLDIKGDINRIVEYNNKLWLSTQFDGALAVDFPGPGTYLLEASQYRGAEGISDQIFDIYVDSDQQMYCITDIGIKLYDKENDVFRTYSPDGLTNYFTTIVMFEDSKGGRWFGTYHGGLYYLPPAKGEIIVYDARDGLANNWISCITEDSKGRIWVGTFGGGITVFDDGEMVTYNNNNGLDASKIQSILEDKEGNMIITSQNNGVHIYKGDHFINYISDHLFRDKNVWAIFEDKHKRFWFGTNDGISLYDPAIGMPSFYYSEIHNIGDEIRFIVSDTADNIWVGTNQRGVFRYDYGRNDFIFDRRLNGILYNDLMVTGLAVDKSNNLYVGTNEGVARWNISEREGKRYTMIDGLAGLRISSLYTDSRGQVWIGSSQEVGLTRYDPGEDEFTIIELGYKLAPRCIAETSDGTIWLGTEYGVIGLRGDTVSYHLTENDGLLSNIINLLQPDNRGNLYIGSNNGLNRFNTAGKTINTYTEQNGFVGIETKKNASFADSRGHLWFGTANGATMLAPELIPPPDTFPLTHIKRMTVNFEDRKMEKDLRLRYTEKNIAFDYYSVCLTNPSAVSYRVMLEGADPEWRPETEQTTAIYSSLSPGKYTFKVKAQNSDGIWNKDPVSYSFVIKPPFYARGWFIFLIIILIAVGIIIYIKIREQNLIKEKRILEEKVAERTEEVVQKSMVIEEKNRDITASIRYAERIQMAMLPPGNSIEDTFVLFLPKDIVSGDFYWMYDNGDTRFIAAVDCTGHGVPGAFMSIIGHNSLTKIVSEYEITSPARILDQLNAEVNRALIRRGDEVINDGMDLSLIAYHKESGKLEYAGAYNPLVIIRDGEIISVKADRFPIGMASARDKKFTNKEVDIRSGDMLYMFSDGYADQFGGPSDKKFKVVNLKKEFRRVYNLPMAEQKEHLLKVLHEWMGTASQVDDILIIGTRVP